MPEAAALFGRYRLLEELGTGGMAVVYRAVVDGPEGFARQVVLKRILPRLSSNPKFVKMFLAEARLCALLHHPAIVQVHDLGEVAGDYFLAMEFVDGLDLATVLRAAAESGRPLPPGAACYITLALAEGLAYAHALCAEDGRPLEIVHRDVSPSNVMVTAQGGVKLLDFGIARVASHARDEHTRTGTLKGKISYMSPEQADGKKEIDRRSDVFALGIVLWECLTAQRLFRGDDDLETLARIRECKVWPPSSVRCEIDADLDTLVLKMLARTPDARYQTCDQVAAALQPLVHRLEGSAGTLKQYLNALGAKRQTSPGEAVTSSAKRGAQPSGGGTVTGSHGELLSGTTGARRERRRGWLLAASTAVLGAVALTFVLLRPSASPSLPASADPPPSLPTSAGPPPALPPAGHAPPTPPATSVAPPPVLPPAAPPSPAPVRLSVRGPRGAPVIVDGKPAGRLPLELALPSTSAARTITVQLEGHAPFKATIVGDADQTVTVPSPRKRPRAPGEPELRDPFAP